MNPELFQPKTNLEITKIKLLLVSKTVIDFCGLCLFWLVLGLMVIILSPFLIFANFNGPSQEEIDKLNEEYHR